MNKNEIEKYLKSLSNEDLQKNLAEAWEELQNSFPESERHQECFAAVVLFAQEKNNRNLNNE